MAYAPVTSPPTQPAQGRAQAARGRPRGEGRSGGGQARCYSFAAWPEAIASDAVITSIVSVCHTDASILFDSGSTYSYVSSYFARYLDMPRESLVLHVHVSMSVGDSIIVDRMDWSSPYHAILDCHAKTVTLEMPVLPRIEWRGSLDNVPSRVISYMKAQRMVGKGCLSYLAFVRDVSADTPTIDSFPIVRDFPDVFLVDLPSMPHGRDIDFCIDLVLVTQPVSIPPYHVAPT
ncbi:uncharacterized protein [Nicotiana tomentosiformis]|uniref:uncharacterized protein n=1 Tax=Nicotiana tomentosiformis TaxID=4098 RepID=UPI00388CDEE2